MLARLGVVIVSATLILINPVMRDVKTTGYCPMPPCVDEKWADGMTASGTKARRGVCASDWVYFPKGAVLHVPGYGMCVVEDTGNPDVVHGKHLDLFFDTYEEAVAWGVQYHTIGVSSWPQPIRDVTHTKGGHNEVR